MPLNTDKFVPNKAHFRSKTKSDFSFAYNVSYFLSEQLNFFIVEHFSFSEETI